MDTELERHIARARSLPDVELHRDMGAYVSGAAIHIAAKAELARRESRRAFWRKDIVAWIALALSILSLVLHLVLTH